MPAMKRPSAAPVAPPKKSPKVAKPTQTAPAIDPFVEKCDIVADALRTQGGKPTEMLISMLPFAAAAPPRHKFQEATLDLVQRELEAQVTAIKGSITTSQAMVSGADRERDRRSAAVVAATSAVEAKTTAHLAAKAAEASAKNEVKAAREAAAAARAEQKEGDLELNAAEEKLLFITTSIEGKVGLENAEGSAEELKPRAAQLSTNLTKVLDDVGLRNAVVKALSKAVADRAMFDNMVIKQLSEELNKSLAAVQKVIADGGPGKAARAAKVNGCDATLSALLDKQVAAEMAESNLAAEVVEAQSALHSAKDAVNTLSSEVEAAAAEINSAELRLSEFQRDVLQTWTDLRDPIAAAAREKAAKDAEMDRLVAQMNAEAEAAAAKQAAEEAAAAEAERAAAEAAAAKKAAQEAEMDRQVAAMNAEAEAAAAKKAAEEAAAEKAAAEAAAAQAAADEAAAAEAAAAQAAAAAAAAQPAVAFSPSRQAPVEAAGASPAQIAHSPRAPAGVSPAQIAHSPQAPA